MANEVARRFGNQNNQLMLSFMVRPNFGNVDNRKYDFEVIFKDSTKRIIHSKIYFDKKKHKAYLLSEINALPDSDSLRKQKIYPSQTLSISRSGKVGYKRTPYTMAGNPIDSCWMFKAIAGSSINVFSYLSEREDGQFAPSTMMALQQWDGPIVKFSKENLQKMLEDDFDATEAFKDKNYYKAITIYNKNVIKFKKTKPPAATQ